MQKKIITSLLVSPLAFTAMANIDIANVDNEKWTSPSVTGGSLVQGGLVTGSLGVGTITQTVDVPCPGTYQLEFVSATNIAVTVSDNVETISSEGGIVTFKADGKCTVTISVKSEDEAQKFTFASCGLAILYNFDDAKAEMTTALEAALNAKEVGVEVNEDDEAALEVAEGLNAEAAEIQNSGSGIKADINALPAESAAKDVKLKSYVDNKLYEEPNPIQAKIDALLEKTDELNAKVENFDNNYPALVGLNGGADDLQDAFETQNARLAADAVTSSDEAKNLSENDQSAAAEFVAETCSEDADAVAEAIANYKAEIADAYADLTAEVDFEPTKTAADLKDEISGLTEVIDAAYQNVADYAALNGKGGIKDQLAEAVNDAQDTILAIKSVSENKGVYSKKQSEWLSDINTANDNATEVFDETEFANASENLEANKEALTTAQNAINKVVTGATELSETQNQNMTEALASLESLQQEYDKAAKEDAVKELNLTSAQKTEYNTLITDAQDKLDTLKKAINDAYNILKLTSDSYSTADAEAAIAAVKEFTDGIQSMIKAQEALNDFKTYLTTASKELGIDGVEVDLTKKFENNIDALQNAVNAVTSDTEQYVLDGIQTNQQNAEKLVGALTIAHDAYTDFNEAISRLTTKCTSSTLIDGSPYAGYTTLQNEINNTTDGYKTLDAKWQQEYLAAIDDKLSNEECFEAATNLGNEISKYGWEGKVSISFNNYIDGLTKDNLDIADDALNLVAQEIPSLASNTDPKSAYNTALTSFKKIKADSEAALGLTDKDKKLQACNAIITRLEALWGPVDKTGTLNNMNQNCVDYKDFIGQIDAQLGTPLNDINKYVNDNYGKSSAYNYYIGLCEELEENLADLKTTLGTQLKNLTVYANKTVTQKHINEYTAQNGLNGGIYKTILSNESAHNNVLVLSKEAKVNIIENLAKITEYEGAEQYATEWINQLADLRDGKLYDTDEATEAAYAAGESLAEETDLMNTYREIIDESNSILEDFNGGWDALVKAHNQEFLDGTDWQSALADMNLTYIHAINAFNGYTQLNLGYTNSAKFQEVSTNNADLFNLNADATALKATVEKVITAANGDGKALTPEEFEELALTPAADIIADMTEQATQMIKDFNGAAKVYYADIEPEAAQKLEDVNAMLADAPYSYKTSEVDEILEPYNTDYEEALEAYEGSTAVDEEDITLDNYTDTFGYVMGMIADKFDDILKMNLNEQVVAKVWNPAYEEVMSGENGFDDLLEELESYNIPALESVYQEELDNFNAEKTKAENLDKSVKSETMNLLAVTGGKSLIDRKEAELQGYLIVAAKIVATVKEYYDYNQTVTGFDSDLEENQNALDGLNKVVTLGGVESRDLSGVEASVKDFQATLLKFKSKKATESEVTLAKDTADAALASACNSAYTEEGKYLVGILDDLKVAYNDAYANEDTRAQAEGYLTTVNQCIESQEALAHFEYPDEMPSVFYDQASELENTISKAIVELQDIHTPAGKENYKDTVLEDLGVAYDNAVGAVNDAKKELDNADPRVAEEYSADYESLISALEAVQAEYEAAGADVVAQKPYYESQIADLQGQIKDIQLKIVNAETQVGYLNALLGQWGDVNDEFLALKATADGYGVALYKDVKDGLSKIGDKLEAINEYLEALYAGRELKANTSIDDELEPVTELINSTTLTVSKEYGSIRKDVAQNAIDEVSAWLKDLSDNDIKLVPGATTTSGSIGEAIIGLTTRLTANNLALTNYNTNAFAGDKFSEGEEAINAILDEYTAIIEDANKLLTDARDNSYQLGDLNNDGEVNVGDLVIMRQLIIDRVSYSDLLEENMNEAYAANIIGDNRINIADYTALVKIILTDGEEDAQGNTLRRLARADFFGVINPIEASGNIAIETVAEENGIRTYAISVNDPNAFVAGQIDLRVKSTSRIVDVRGASRLDNHDVMFDDNGETTRVLITSLDNSEFNGIDGVTLYVDVEGHSGLGFENALFTDAEAQAYIFEAQDPDTTGIDSIYEGTKAVKEAIYDAAGRVMKKVQRGINIIRNSNGKVTKEMHK